MPPLLRAYKIQKKAAKKGFDWKDAEGPWSKIQEEIAELKEASLTKTKDEIEKELGDVLFSVVNLARHLDVDPNLALASTNQKFMKRFAYVEEKMELSGEQMNPENLEIMDKFALELEEVCTVEKQPKLEGRSMLMFLAPKPVK